MKVHAYEKEWFHSTSIEQNLDFDPSVNELDSPPRPAPGNELDFEPTIPCCRFSGPSPTFPAMLHTPSL